MTEKFMKLSDFLKLIKNEDEQDTAGDNSAAGDSLSENSQTERISMPEKTSERFDFSKAFNIFSEEQNRHKIPVGGQTPKMPVEEQPELSDVKKKDISDDELASILRYFGWKIPTAAKAEPPAPKIPYKAFELQVSAAPEPVRRVETVKQDKSSKKKAQIFDGLDSKVIKEIFTQEELDELRGEETHVFSEAEARTITGNIKANKKRTRKSSIEETSGADEDYIEDYSPVSRRKTYRTGCFGGLLYFGFIICASVILCAFTWLAANDVLSLNKAPITADIYVGESKSIDQIATELKDNGIIKYKWLFELFADYSHASKKIDPGTYSVSSQLDYRAIITKLQKNSGWSGQKRDTVTVLIPEGKSMTEIFKILSDADVCSYDTLLDYEKNNNFDYDFLKDVNSKAQYKLEGYLFPDTYEFYVGSTPQEALTKLLNNYKAKVMTDEIAMQLKSSGRSMNEILIVASLIEKEAGSEDERPEIASVIYNRLKSNSYPYLQIDATVQYALGEHKERLTYQDRMVDSIYNTYLQKGLPPGPIASPGLASIRAALKPNITNYYFYALNKQGTHEFFADINSFNKFVASDKFGG